MNEKKLRLEFEKIENDGIEIVFYFNDEKVFNCPFLEEDKSFSHINKILEDFLSGKSAKLRYGETRSIVGETENYINVINSDVFLKFELFQSHSGEYPNRKYDLNTTRFTITKKDYEFIDHEDKYTMEGNTEQIISEIYFTVLKYLAKQFCNKVKNKNINWLQEYNDSKSVKIEEFLYPELKSYYSVEINKSKIHKKSQLINRIEIRNDKNIENVFAERKELKPEIELLYKYGDKEFIVLPIEELKK